MSMLSSVAPFAVVTPFDPAIDDDASGGQDGISMYTETREMHRLKFFAGQKPTIYYVRRLPVSRVVAMGQQTSEQKLLFAFMSAVVRVDNVRVEGGTLDQWVPEWCKPGSEITSQSMTIAEIDSGLFTEAEIYDIGGVALDRANLGPGRPVCYAPLLSSAHAWARKIRSSQRAEPTALPSNTPSEPNIQQTQT